jgi:hypothetical protein
VRRPITIFAGTTGHDRAVLSDLLAIRRWLHDRIDPLCDVVVRGDVLERQPERRKARVIRFCQIVE